MKKKVISGPTVFDQMRWNLQDKLKVADEELELAKASLKADEEAVRTCPFYNERREYENDVQYSESVVNKALEKRDKIIQEIQSIEK